MTMLVFSVLTATASDVLKKPATFESNPGLTSGEVENFRELFVDPMSLPGSLQPSAPGDGTAKLAIRNDYLSWSEVTVGDVKVGIIGPLTDGLIHGVQAGTYDVELAYPNGHVWSGRIATDGSEVAAAPTPEPEPPKASVDSGSEEVSEEAAEENAGPSIKAATSGE